MAVTEITPPAGGIATELARQAGIARLGGLRKNFMLKTWAKAALVFTAGALSAIAFQAFAQLNGETTIPDVRIRDIKTQKDILVCKYAMFLADGHYVMCGR